MQISYLDPLAQAWARMRSLLFAPFVLRTWFVVGFTAWLAGIFDSNGSASSAWGSDDDGSSRWGESAIDFFEALTIGLLVIFVVAVLILLLLLLLWLSSRTKFVFLDNVVQGQAQVVEPWKRYAARGDSLFLWRFAFGLIVLLVVLLMTLPLILTTGIVRGVGPGELSALTIFSYIFGLVVLVVIPAVYISLFLDSFIVPIMYKFDLSATQAWKRFLPLLRAQPLHFVLYGIMILFLNVIVAAVIIGVGLFTCCVGFVLFALPYLGTVFTLPVWVTFRAFSLTYLGQFGPEFRLLSEPAPSAGPPVPPPPPAPPQPPRQIT